MNSTLKIIHINIDISREKIYFAIENFDLGAAADNTDLARLGEKIAITVLLWYFIITVNFLLPEGM